MNLFTKIIYYLKRIIYLLFKENFHKKLKYDWSLYPKRYDIINLREINKYNLNDIWMNTNLMCMSEKISSVLNNIKWKKIFLFNAGEEEYLLYKI